jgi:BirA family biotin operon repressor/biotin-[acetyl-CoA-carboxylase] ligase
MSPFLSDSDCFFVDTTTSTNLLLNEIVENYKLLGVSLPNFFCVATNFQTAGRGQRVKKWLSTHGDNILSSFYFQPNLSPPQQIFFNYFFALTIRKTLSLYVNHVMIKKPNDIWVDNNKMAGILIEHNIQGEKLNYTVAGVGINVNQTQFCPSLINPVSLKLITGKNFSRKQILDKIVQIGKEYYIKLQNGAFMELEKEYEKYIKDVQEEEKTD